MKRKQRNSDDKLLNAYEHLFLLVFFIAAFAFTTLYLWALGIVGHHPTERIQLEDCSSFAHVSLWGLGIVGLYGGGRLLMIYLTRPVLGDDTEAAYPKKVTL